jgi:hypothetical protein
MSRMIDAKRRAQEDKIKRKKMEEASRKMDALAKRLGKWDPEGNDPKIS